MASFPAVVVEEGLVQCSEDSTQYGTWTMSLYKSTHVRLSRLYATVYGSTLARRWMNRMRIQGRSR